MVDVVVAPTLTHRETRQHVKVTTVKMLLWLLALKLALVAMDVQTLDGTTYIYFQWSIMDPVSYNLFWIVAGIVWEHWAYY